MIEQLVVVHGRREGVAAKPEADNQEVVPVQLCNWCQTPVTISGSTAMA